MTVRATGTARSPWETPERSIDVQNVARFAHSPGRFPTSRVEAYSESTIRLIQRFATGSDAPSGGGSPGSTGCSASALWCESSPREVARLPTGRLRPARAQPSPQAVISIAKSTARPARVTGSSLRRRSPTNIPTSTKGHTARRMRASVILFIRSRLKLFHHQSA